MNWCGRVDDYSHCHRDGVLKSIVLNIVVVNDTELGTKPQITKVVTIKHS
jgi:hypothetical protein